MARVTQDLTEIPETFAAGTTLKYTRSSSDYPANDGWTLTVGLRGPSVKDAATVVASGADYVVTFPAADTATLDPGMYHWVEKYVHGTKGTFYVTGDVQVTPDVFGATAGELQSVNEKTLAALIAKRDSRLTADQETLQVDGMAIARIPFEQLEKLIARYQARVNAERRGSSVKVTPIAWSRHR